MRRLLDRDREPNRPLLDLRLLGAFSVAVVIGFGARGVSEDLSAIEGGHPVKAGNNPVEWISLSVANGIEDTEKAL